jgi:hypothetical protein
VSTKLNPSALSGAETVTPTELATALKLQALRKRGKIIKEKPTAADKLLRHVEISAAAVMGSNAEQSKHRRDVMAYIQRFGQCHNFITLTPNNSQGITICYYAGMIKLESLFDAKIEDLPDPVVVEKIAMSDSFASARLYDRIISIFFKTALGWDTENRCSNSLGGLFGKLAAFYGMTEPQKDGNLHLHLLLWVKGLPRPILSKPLSTFDNDSNETENIVDDTNELENLIVEYGSSLVTNELPVKLSPGICTVCQHEVLYTPLPIRDSYRRKVTPIRSNSFCSKNTDPKMAECPNCKSQYSSGKLIDMSLAKCRSELNWPVLFPPFSDSELSERIEIEHKSRLNIINTKENILKRYSTINNVTNTIECEYNRESDDILKNILMLPPSLDYFRLPEYSKYTISSLAATVMQHKSNHCNSCFKKSVRTTSSNECRYGFPKERVNFTALKDDGLQFSRTLGHEYINGFNQVINKNITTQFKLNIQFRSFFILFGATTMYKFL